MKVLQHIAREHWLKRVAEHQKITSSWITPRLTRRAVGQKHPVDDFLFDYYPISPAKLSTWVPSFEERLEAEIVDFEYFDPNVYEFSDGVISVRSTWLQQHEPKATSALNFLTRVASRAPRIGCFALHEWAMVLDVEQVRHQSWPLRLTQSEIADTIDEIGLRCTHFDAFRFFTPTARPKNPQQLSRDSQIEFDQPGCLHANMDLYRIAFAHSPIVGAEIVREAFALAKEIRTVDMQVAPYDLAALGVQPIPIETPAGRQQFSELQAAFSERAATLRAKLIDQLTRAYFH